MWCLWLLGSSAHFPLWPAGKETSQPIHFLLGLGFTQLRRAFRAANSLPLRYHYEMIWRESSEPSSVCGLSHCVQREKLLYFRTGPGMLVPSPENLLIHLSRACYHVQNAAGSMEGYFFEVINIEFVWGE